MLPALRHQHQLADAADDSPPAFRPQKLLSLAIRLWWVPLVTVCVSLVAATTYVVRKPPAFVSRARMWQTEKMRLPEGELFSEDMQNFLGTQSELLQSANLRRLTVERLRASSPNVIPVSRTGAPQKVKVTVTQEAKSSIFVLEATGSDAAFTRAYLDALMDIYLQYKKDVRKTVSGDTLASITEQVQKWERDLKAEQDQLTVFQRSNNMAILQEEGTVAGGYLARLQTQLSDLQLEDRLLNAADATDAVFTASVNVADATGGAPHESTAGGSFDGRTAANDLMLLRVERNRLSRIYRPKHPKMIKLNEDIEREETLIAMFQQQNREQLDALRRENKLKTEDIEASIKDWQKKVVEANALLAEAERLKLNVQRVQSVYDRLVALVQNVGISRDIDQDNLSILEQASLAVRSYTQEEMVFALAIVGGLGIGLGVIALLAIRDDRFNSASEIEEKFGDAIVGQVPEVFAGKRGEPLPLLESNDRRHIYSEAYRSLRSALLFAVAEGKRPRTLLITSAVPDEGKSTIVANLARILALGGSTVVLVDADLRQGSLHRLMRMQKGPGLAELLRQTASLDQTVQRDPIPGLSFISRGGDPGDPGDLFLSPTFEQLLDRLRQEFNYVLIDSCPVFAADDATTIAPKVEGTLFVVRNRYSSGRAVESAIQMLRQRRANVLGLIFNRANTSARSYYNYNYARYSSAVSDA